MFSFLVLHLATRVVLMQGSLAAASPVMPCLTWHQRQRHAMSDMVCRHLDLGVIIL